MTARRAYVEWYIRQCGDPSIPHEVNVQCARSHWQCCWCNVKKEWWWPMSMHERAALSRIPKRLLRPGW